MLEKSVVTEIMNIVAQAPLVALFAYLWWRTRQDYSREIKYLEERSKAKDERIKELIVVVDRFNLTLELIKDRLR